MQWSELIHFIIPWFRRKLIFGLSHVVTVVCFASIICCDKQLAWIKYKIYKSCANDEIGTQFAEKQLRMSRLYTRFNAKRHEKFAFTSNGLQQTLLCKYANDTLSEPMNQSQTFRQNLVNMALIAVLVKDLVLYVRWARLFFICVTCCSG